jgi:hypothetical protein
MAVAKELGQKEVFDLGAFDSVTRSNEGIWIPILHPITGEETSTEFCMLGPDSAEYTAWQDEQAKKTQEYMIREMANARLKKKRSATEQAQLDLETDIDLLCRLTKGWKEARWNGEELEFTPENVRMVFSKNAVIRLQLRRDIEDRERFFMMTSKA